MKGFAYYTSYVNMAETVQGDAACGYVRSGDPTATGYSLAKACREGTGDMDEFLISARQYIAMTGDRNTRVIPFDETYKEWDNGFHARRIGEHVYVTEVTGETELKPGDEIYAVGNETISELRKHIGHNIFFNNQDERENWDQFFRMFQTAVVFPGDGTGKRVSIRHFPIEEREPELSFKDMGNGILYFRVESFADPDKLSALLNGAAEALKTCSKMILDLRKCEADGEPENFLPILPYLVDADISGEELFPARTICTSYTKTNVARYTHLLREEADAESDPEAKAYLEGLIADAEEKGEKVAALRKTKTLLYERKQFNEIEEQEESGLEGVTVHAAEGGPAKVVILTDVDTCYAGEWLVSAVKGMKKVTVLGRATAGMLDYTDLIYMDYEDIMVRFVYPMSRTKASKEGNGVQFKGIEPDIYVPLTREECRDSDLLIRKALEL